MLTSERREELIGRAIEARKMAYAPYSNYLVGAAVLAASGRVFTGANVENAAYPNSLCAERVAIFKAVSEGEREFVALAVVTGNGGMPCGACRQAMAEFGLDMRVLVACADGSLRQEATVSELLPGAFGPGDLGK
ncbi:MAG: cytidine deaminase [Chloroflexi bacterium RBG_16_54_11]|nr:MAG: cytidine deaminase [Chloroflexi bacterium RBG_16_54_11]